MNQLERFAGWNLLFLPEHKHVSGPVYRAECICLIVSQTDLICLPDCFQGPPKPTPLPTSELKGKLLFFFSPNGCKKREEIVKICNIWDLSPKCLSESDPFESVVFSCCNIITTGGDIISVLLKKKI